MGNEWFVTTESSFTANSEQPVLAVKTRNRVAEDIKDVKTYITARTGNPIIGVEQYRSEANSLYQMGLDEAYVGVGAHRPYLIPVATPSFSTWTNSAGAAANAHQSIDDGPLYDTSDYARATAIGSPRIQFRMGWVPNDTNGRYTPAGIPAWAGRRITGLGLYLFADQDQSVNVQNNGYITFSLIINGVRYTRGGQQLIDDDKPQVQGAEVFFGENPVTGRAWEPADLEGFALGTSLVELQWTGNDDATNNSVVRVYAMYGQVFWVPDLRESVGRATITTTGWNTVSLATTQYRNMLGANQSNFNTADASYPNASATPLGWVNVSNTTVTRNTTGAHIKSGAGSLQLTPTANGTMSVFAQQPAGADTRDLWPVVPGESYTASAYFKAAAAPGRTCRIDLSWWDSGGQAISTTTGTAGQITDGTGGFTRASVTGVAPEDAMYIGVQINVLSVSGAGDIHYVDEAMLERSATVNPWIDSGVLVGAQAYWRKPSSGDTVTVFRRLGSDGSFTIPQLDSGSVCPHLVQNASFTLLPQGTATFAGMLQSTTGYTTAASPVVMTINGGSTASTDSQPYYRIALEEVRSSQTHRQDFTMPATQSLSVVQAVVRAASGGTTSPLQITLRGPRPATTQLGSTITIQPSELVGSRTAFQVVQKAMTTASFTNGNRYFFEFTTGGGSGNGWYVGVLDTGDVANNATFGGTTDSFFFSTTTERDREDASATISIPPTPPANFAAVVSPIPAAIPTGYGDLPGPPPNPNPAGGNITPEAYCANAGIEYAHLTWTPVAGPFSYYQIERQTAIDSTWYVIARLSNIAAASFDDGTGPLGIASTYRMKYIKPDGSESPYTASLAVTPDGGNCKWQITSNGYSKALWLQGSAMGQEIEYGFGGVEGQIFPLYDTGERVEFLATEDRGDSFVLDLMIAGQNDQPASVQGRRVFDLIRQISRTPEMRCVRNIYGDTWCASVRAVSGVQQMPGGRYRVQLEVVELTTVPEMVTTSP